MRNITHLRCYYFSLCSARKKQVLVKLVRPYIGNNSTKTFLVKKPVGPGGKTGTMWTQAYGLYYFSNGSGLYQFACFYGGFVFKPLTIHDRIDAFGFLLHFSYFG